MQVIIDRFEGNLAVCEKADRNMINIPRSKLPPEAKEGDVLVVDGNTIRIDQTETAKRRQAADEMMRRNFQNP